MSVAATKAGAGPRRRLSAKPGPEKTELLVLCQLFYPELVSTGQTLTELCEELAGMEVDVEVVCAPPTILDRKSKVPKCIEHKGIRIRRVWGTRFPKLNLLGRVVNQITFAVSVFFYLLFDFSGRPILVLTNPPFLAIACALMKTFRKRGDYIYLVFDVYPDTAVQLGMFREGGVLTRMWDRLNTFVFQHASAVVVIGRCMHDVIAAKMEASGIESADKIHNIHVWSDDKAIGSTRKMRNPFLEKWNLTGKFVVGYFGNMGRFHDMETIVEAARILKDRDEMVFLFVGEGHKKRYVMELAERWNLKNCRFHPYVDREDLGSALSTADVGLVSLSEGQRGLSVPSKTFGLMAASIPVVAVMAPDSEIARVLVEEDCGSVIRPGDAQGLADALVGLQDNRRRLESMGNNARRAIDEKYNLQCAARAYCELIRCLK